MARNPKNSTPKLTEKLISQLDLHIRRGEFIETAVKCVGISKDTYYRWLRDAKCAPKNSLLRKLSDAVEQALAISEIRDLAIIDAAAKAGCWKASAWRLERRAKSAKSNREPMILGLSKDKIDVHESPLAEEIRLHIEEASQKMELYLKSLPPIEDQLSRVKSLDLIKI